VSQSTIDRSPRGRERARTRFWIGVWAAVLLVLPVWASPFHLDLACQVFIACIGSLTLMLLTGFAGQISLGHAGLLAAGAFTTGILFRETGAPFWLTIPAAAIVGAVLGLVFGIPSLRLRGIYLAVSTIALHFMVIYLGGEYENTRGLSSGIVVDPPSLFGWSLDSGRPWYYVLLALAAVTYLLFANILRTRTGRAWSAIRSREAVAEALGINIARYKLLAFVISSSVTAVAGALLTYYRTFVSSEAFSLDVTIQYVAMIIIGGMGSQFGALLGAASVTLLPYAIEGAMQALPGGAGHAEWAFAVNYAAFGIVMCAFLLFEPHGLIAIWRRIRHFLGRRAGVAREPEARPYG
jgi:branched-chain amino acid transport system permease protein